MHAWPLVERELRAALRRPSTRRLRMVFAACGMGGVIWGLLVWTGTAAGVGALFFRGLLLAAAFSGMAAALFAASDSIARERREDTLRFLFLSNLRAQDVVAGKFAAAGLVPASLLLAMLPPLAMSAVVGQVPAEVFLRGVLALGVGLIWSLALCLRISAECVQQKTAQGISAAALLLAQPTLLAWAATSDTPLVASLFWPGLALALGGAWVCLKGATRRVEAVWREQGVLADARESAASRRAVQDEANPLTVLWAARLRRGKGRMMGGLVLLALAGAISFSRFPFPETALAVLAAAQIAYLLIGLTRVAYAFQQDRSDGSLELLLGTPLELEQLFEAFRRALVHQARPALLAFTAASAGLSAALFAVRTPVHALLPLAMAATLWIAFLSIGWVTLFRSLMSQHPFWAMLSAFLRVFLAPVLLSGFLLLAPAPEVPKVLVLWVFSTLFAGAFFALDARTALLQHGRELLLRPFAEKPPEIESEWSCMNWEETLEPAPQTQAHAA